MTPSEYEQLQDRLRKKLEYCNGLYGKRREGFEEGIMVAMSILNSVKPHIQAVKKQNPIDTVKHGHWIHGSSSENIRVTCSECGKRSSSNKDEHLEYCCHCGAKMDGESNGV